MCLVYAGTLWLWWTLVLEDVGLWGIPEAGIVYRRYTELLGYAGDPGGDALLSSVIIRYDEGYLKGINKLE